MNLLFVKNYWHYLPDCWKKTFVSILAATLLSVLIFFETWSSIVEIWARSKTYTHGYIIAPISIWLIWLKKHHYKKLCSSTSWLGLIAIIGSGFLWLAANLINVLVVQQYAVVGMLLGSFWAILGTRVALKMIFPLAFLLLMVPVGEPLIPPLMEYTATFTVAMLRLTGLSVFREGMHFSLTSGHWSVVEACSGINYLIASITLGLVFAYVTYSSYWKRGIFFICSIVVPIIANGFRAYMIVMIGHLSGMKLAVGVDHILYGAVFFGIVIMLLFYVGSFWKDPPESADRFFGAEVTNTPDMHRQLVTVLPLICLCFIIWPLSSSLLKEQQHSGNALIQNFSFVENTNWHLTDDPGWNWSPKYSQVAKETMHFFNNAGNIVGLYQANFGIESQGGGELVNSQNFLISPEDRQSGKWRLFRSGSSTIVLGNNKLAIDESIIKGRYRDLIIQCWYVIGSKNTANPYLAKWQQLVKRLTGDSSPELQVMIFTEAPQNRYGDVKSKLNSFSEIWPATPF